MHVGARQAPASQRSPAAQGAFVYPRPSASQTRRVVASAQVAERGVQTIVGAAAHTLSAVQRWPVAQSASPLHSTQTPRVAWHTCPMPEHSREERHGGVGRSHTPLAHACPVGQSRSTRQSTQWPAATSHTWSGHVRDEVQATLGTQRPRLHVAPAPHCDALTHCTQDACALRQ